MPVRRSPDAKTNGRSSPCRVGEQVELSTRYKSLANSWKELKEEMIMKAKKSKIISILLCSFMILVLLPTVAFAEGTSVAWIGETGYETLEDAVNHAVSGDTIVLGEGKYTLYGKKADTKGKDLTFVGQGADKTEWGIGATMPDPDKFGTEYNGDYSFDGSGTITFKNMTLQSSTADYLGFIRADKTVVENCVINGKTFYWGYKTASFINTIFNCPSGDYALWTYSSPEMNFDGCTFNSSGKTINVYTDGIGNFNCDFVINFNNCTVNGNTPEGKKDKAVMNINDSLMGNYNFIINLSGKNVVNGVTPDDLNKEYAKQQKDITCSRWFEFNTKYGNGNSGHTTVSIDGIKVWENGNMVGHEIDTENDCYTDGYKDDAYTITVGDWEKTDEDCYIRLVTKVCNYCGRTSEYEETGYSVTYTDGVDNTEIFKDQTTIVPDGDATPEFDGGTPTRDGYTFEGWNPDVDETVTKSVTYKAVWKEVLPTTPQTGDNSYLTLWISLVVASAFGIAGTTVYRRRKILR